MKPSKTVTKSPPALPAIRPKGDEIYLPINEINQDYFEKLEERRQNSLWLKPKPVIAFYTVRYFLYIYAIIYIALAFHHYVQMFVRT